MVLWPVPGNHVIIIVVIYIVLYLTNKSEQDALYKTMMSTYKYRHISIINNFLAHNTHTRVHVHTHTDIHTT